MSSGQLDLQVAEMRAAAPRFESASHAVDDILQTLQGALAAEDGCWGSSEIGSQFAAHYLPHQEQAKKNLATLVTALHSTATAVTNAVIAFEQTERDNAYNFGTGD